MTLPFAPFDGAVLIYGQKPISIKPKVTFIIIWRIRFPMRAKKRCPKKTTVKSALRQPSSEYIDIIKSSEIPFNRIEFGHLHQIFFSSTGARRMTQTRTCYTNTHRLHITNIYSYLRTLQSAALVRQLSRAMKKCTARR